MDGRYRPITSYTSAGLSTHQYPTLAQLTEMVNRRETTLLPFTVVCENVEAFMGSRIGEGLYCITCERQLNIGDERRPSCPECRGRGGVERGLIPESDALRRPSMEPTPEPGPLTTYWEPCPVCTKAVMEIQWRTIRPDVYEGVGYRHRFRIYVMKYGAGLHLADGGETPIGNYRDLEAAKAVAQRTNDLWVREDTRP